jgi:hypothetical protein
VYQRHKPPQEIGAVGHPVFVAGEASWSSSDQMDSWCF